MEEQCSPLSWAYYFQEEGVEDLKQSLFYSTLELEAAVIAAHEEISRKDDEIAQLKGLLAKIIKERDEFEAKYQRVSLENQNQKQLVFQQTQIQAHSPKQQQQPPPAPSDCPISSGTTSNEDDNSTLSPSDCDDNIVVAVVAVAASPGSKDIPPPTDVTDRVPIKKALPEHGKFLQAVMEAGPLLQTLLLAGPLPQWQHPPPQLSSGDIPPVTMSSPRSKIGHVHQDSCHVSPSTSGGGFTNINKRGMLHMEASDFSPTSKYQKICSPIMIDPNMIN